MGLRIPIETRESQLSSIKGMKFIEWTDGYRSSHSRATMECEIDGHRWSAAVRDLVDRPHGCPMCAGRARVSESEMIERLMAIGGLEFVGWRDGKYTNSKTKALVKCSIDGTVWSSVVLDLQKGHGCPKCGRDRTTAKRSSKQPDVEARFSSLGVKFCRWVDGSYKNSYSKAVMLCERHGEYTQASNAILNGYKCPSCSKSGFDPHRVGYVYALVSDCGGMVKIGITNNVSDRVSFLTKNTPFPFSLVEYAKFEVGYDAAKTEKDLHSNLVSAGLSGFNGCTEWFVFNESAANAIDVMRKLNGA